MTGEARRPDGDTGPLDGITVLDASRVLVGPFCTMQLGDLGAEVIKVERPEVGDQTRGWHPPTYGESGEAAYYASVNRNKRSVELNLKTDEGKAAFADLAAEADVLVENFRVGTMESWGIGYEDLREENPGLVYAKLSGYGEWGPKRDEPAYDLMMQAEGGMMSITGEEDGAPVRVGVAIADITASMYATQGVLAALFERELGDGVGQKVDVSLLDGQAALMSYQAANYFASGSPPGRMGSKHPNLAPYQAFETADGYVVVACASENLWPKFCDAIDRPGLAEDERFATNTKRITNRDELDAVLSAELGGESTAALLARFEEHGVPASDVKDMEEVFASPQVEAREMAWDIDHPTAGSITVPGSPMKFSHSQVKAYRHPPLLGEHTEEVLREYGYGDEELGALRDAGAIPEE
ncbi:CaiB/BaiF CoA transferase family protein [Halocalculus aciditolerans]|uniref:CoA transferase n=1 Tax=Halocalculus aciditolerans TaxID=1383812 RepID=A0A830F7C3_9EURY|nr:CaiB/BaiF CoA-transferase family protein [Halocalculus aciditolerans]GGL70353.1 CoA transferase [Halocalculus aciditolerans]